MAQHNETGKLGEEFAVRFLQENGHEVLARNFRFGQAEIDIVSKHGNIIVFSEVKTRATDKYGFPEQAVSKVKQKLISKAATFFMEKNRIQSEVRFDVLSLTKTYKDFDVHWIKDAFFPIY